MVNDPNNLHYEEKLKELGLFPQGKESSGDMSSMYSSTSGATTKRMKVFSSQFATWTRQGLMGGGKVFGLI